MLAEAWLVLPLIAAGLKVLGYRRMRTALAPVTAGGDRREDPATALRTSRLVASAASRCPVQVNCLARSLGLYVLLRRQDLAAELRIGAGKVGGSFAAHAWVEHCGAALNEPAAALERIRAFEKTLPGGDGRPA